MQQNILNAIKSMGYDIIKNERKYTSKINFLDIILLDGTKKRLPLTDRELTIGANNAVVTTGEQIYKEFYGVENDTEWRFMLCECSRQTFDAIEAERKRLGFIEVIGSIDGMKIKHTEKFLPALPETSNIVLSKLNNGLWCVSFEIGYGEYTDVHYIYANRPTEEVFLKTPKFLKITRAFYSGKKAEHFYCTTCGEEKFWLNCGHDIYECYDNCSC